jgi:diaminopimelate decarboxylase
VSRPWWSRNGLDVHGSRLRFASRDAEAIAREHGTPLYVFDTARVEDNLRRLDKAFQSTGGRHHLLFALKANRHPEVLARIRATGLAGIDACSPNEVDLALETGWRPEEISYTGTCLSPRDLDRILAHPIRINLDSLSAVRQVGERSPGRAIGLRINPGVGAGYTSRTTYAGDRPTKFGIYPDQFDEALELARRHQLVVRGLHFHVGSGWLRDGVDSVFEAARRVGAMARKLGDLQYINVGGGIGLPLKESDTEVDVDAYASGLARSLGGLEATIVCEPGDYIVRDAGIVLVEVVCIDRKGGVTFVGVDCGYNAYSLPVICHYPQEVVLCRAADAAPASTYTIAGHINEAIDLFAEDCRLPELREGDVLALLNAGGYATALASEHCFRPHAGQIVL